MGRNGHGTRVILKILLIAAATAGAILSTLYSLTHGITQVFPFLYLLPIILVIYFFPRYGVAYSLCLSVVFISLVYYFGSSNHGLVAVSTAWFAIFMAIAVVASSYANRLREEGVKIRKVFENTQDGLFCFDRCTKKIVEINPKCARMLRYAREDLIGKEVSQIWPAGKEFEDFLSCVGNGEGLTCRQEILMTAQDGPPCRCIISAILTAKDLILCSVFDITSQRCADEEIRSTLEDLERQVRERTAHLERLNEELKAEILERRSFENAIMSKEQRDERERRGGP